MQQNKRFRNFGLENLRPVFHLREQEAATQLGISKTYLKLISRALGIKRWPFRKLQAIDEKISARRTTANDPKETPFERTKALQDLEIFHEERKRILRLDGEKSAKEELDLIAGVQESAPNGSTPIALTDAIGPNPGDTIDFTDFMGIVRAGQMTPAILDSPERMAEFRAAARAPCRLTFPIQEFSEGTKDSVVEPSKLKELSESSKEIPDSDD